MSKKLSAGNGYTNDLSRTQPQADEEAPAKSDQEVAPASTLPLSEVQVIPPCLLIDARAAAELLNIGESTLWKLHSQGRIPNPMRLGGRVVRWRREELEAWVRAGCPARHLWRPDDRNEK